MPNCKYVRYAPATVTVELASDAHPGKSKIDTTRGSSCIRRCLEGPGETGTIRGIVLQLMTLKPGSTVRPWHQIFEHEKIVE